MGDAPEPIRATVPVDGMQVKERLDGRSTVQRIVGELLPEYERPRAVVYALSPEDGFPLDPTLRIGENDMPDGSVLALAKVNGGGGACDE